MIQLKTHGTTILDAPQQNIPASELASIHLLGALSPGQLDEMGRHCRRVALAAGDELFEHGQAANRFYYLASGLLVLKRMSADGNEKIIDLVRPGQTFGEAIMFMGGQTYPVTAAAVEPSELLEFESAVYKAQLANSVDSCFRLLADMSRRLRKWINEVDALTLQNATCRMVNFLLYLIPEGSTSPVRVDLPAPKHIVASRLSITPETLSRILRQLAEDGMIAVSGQQVTIRDIKALTRYVQL